MKRMREGGATHRQIAKAFQCSTSSVGRALQQEGVTP